MNDPIITSLLDTDFYKYTMGQYVFKHHKGVPVEYTFINRKIPANYFFCDMKSIPLESLKEQLQHVMKIRLTRPELAYLKGMNVHGIQMFNEDYLEHLRTMQIPEFELIPDSLTHFKILVHGPWETAIFWETFIMSIVNELYSYYQMKKGSSTKLEMDSLLNEGVEKLKIKMRALSEYPQCTFSDFGTRRRFSKRWHERVVGYLTGYYNDYPQFIGTSNVSLALKHGLTPIGTSAHELFMGTMALAVYENQDLNKITCKVLDRWIHLYSEALSIALPDTFGTDYFLTQFSTKDAAKWKGVRQDSGNPHEFANKMIKFYEANGIDPHEKMIIFSDGLNVNDICRLYYDFHRKIKVSFGWGTDLTNDVVPIPPKVVVKLSKVYNVETVKLSDTPGKEMGTPEMITKIKTELGIKP